jgi:hypothetical protein
MSLVIVRVCGFIVYPLCHKSAAAQQVWEDRRLE